MSESQTAVAAASTPLFNDLKTAVTTAVTTHVATVQAQAKAVLASLETNVAPSGATVIGDIEADAKAFAAGADVDMKALAADLKVVVAKLQATPHVGWVIGGIVGLLTVGGGLAAALMHFGV